MLPISMLTQDQLDLKVDDSDSYLPQHQPIRRMSTSCLCPLHWSLPLWTITIKLLTIFLKLGHMVLRAWVHMPHLPGKAIKLFFFCVQTFSHVLLSATPWTITWQAPLFMGFSRQEHWVCCHFLLQGMEWPSDWTPISCIGRQILYHQHHLHPKFCLQDLIQFPSTEAGFTFTVKPC